MKIKLKEGQKVFFTSDTHFHHSNICSATTKWDGKGDRTHRQFDSLEEMDETLIKNINNAVGENDILFHLGDWSFGGIEQIWNFRKRLICKNIHLITGNHDHHIIRAKVLPNAHSKIEELNGVITDGPNPKRFGDSRDQLFNVHAKELFSSVNPILNLTIQIPTPSNQKDIKHNFILCHFPIASWEGMGEGFIHLHGHVHLPKELKINEGRAMDVGVDGNDFKPVSLEEVLKQLGKRPIKALRLQKDHHQE
jgi:calcineurin-like phosphoesterase family protein